MTSEERRDVFSKQQATLDRVAVINQISEFKEELRALEIKLNGIEADCAIIWSVLESSGLVHEGEPTGTATPKKIDVEKLIGELKAEKKDSRSAKGPYFLAKQEVNQNEAFEILQRKVKETGGFWSKKAPSGLWKFWFSYNDEKRLCYRKV
jgi:hypothetical protein